ncbi:hypothetical protein KFK09_008761 [Dendrobium nobile]|uniref:Uncharacterized protein n=1 Tax=Dendrobium nobile TaxID=94219 RepID=A0A8T3BNN1_DENNO|nr:hypothetical protein KFK09_008761 [Dendrobium nobile]
MWEGRREAATGAESSNGEEQRKALFGPVFNETNGARSRRGSQILSRIFGAAPTAQRFGNISGRFHGSAGCKSVGLCCLRLSTVAFGFRLLKEEDPSFSQFTASGDFRFFSRGEKYFFASYLRRPMSQVLEVQNIWPLEGEECGLPLQA